MKIGDINQIILDTYSDLDLTEEELIKSSGSIFISLCNILEINEIEYNGIKLKVIQNEPSNN